MKIIGYILIFSGVINVLKSIAKESSSSNNPIERVAFGFFFIVIGALLLKFSKSQK